MDDRAPGGEQSADPRAEPDAIENPYRPPSSAGGGNAPPDELVLDYRPSSPKVLGIFLIICGSLLTLVDLIGGLMTFAGSAMMDSVSSLGQAAGPMNPFGAMEEMDVVYTVTGSLKLVVSALSIVALVAGVGLVGYRAWGRRLSQIWAALALVYIVVDLVVQVAIVMPATRRMIEAMGAQMGGLTGGANPFGGAMGLATSMGLAMSIVSAVVLAVLPILTLALVSRRVVAEACS